MSDGLRAIEACYDQLRQLDHDRYLTVLLAPAGLRDRLVTLYAFNVEIARISEVVSEPMLGEIRLQWWREALQAAEKGEGRGHDVAVALAELHQRHPLPFAAMQTLIDARARDLDDEAFADMAALENYASATSSQLMRIACLAIADETRLTLQAELVEQAGKAYALTGLLRALPMLASRGHVFFPLDVMGRHDVDPHDILSGHMTPAIRLAMDEIIERARGHLVALRTERVQKPLFPALLPASLCDAYLDILARRDFNPFKTACEVAGFRRQLRLMSRVWQNRV
ncbi:MAG: phytoene/squalene synthase family protein [Rhizobiales bacterium]|nr:phytoene/squalene synthase family protein [Hyphomicrobiales bacterium]